MPNPWGGGGSLVLMPTTPAPATLELAKVHLVAQNTNPFSSQQQIQDWQAAYIQGSCTLPPLRSSDGIAWQFFLDLCVGVVNVFQFQPDTVADARYYYWLTQNATLGGPSKYFRLMRNDYKVQITEGGVFKLSFEFREAL